MYLLENKEYIATELALIFHVNRVTITSIKNKLGMKTAKKTEHGATYDVYTLAQAQELGGYFELKDLKERRDYIQDHREAQNKTVNDEHPLVTDLRCLNINYWPDTEPACFQELEEEIN